MDKFQTFLLCVFYSISMIWCFFIVVYNEVRQRKRCWHGERRLKYYLTWGHIIKAALLAVLPIANFVYALVVSLVNLEILIERLNEVNIFNNEREERL
jgi:hypothetical protein